jgi:hypothetical protein
MSVSIIMAFPVQGGGVNCCPADTTMLGCPDGLGGPKRDSVMLKLAFYIEIRWQLGQHPRANRKLIISIQSYLFSRAAPLRGE